MFIGLIRERRIGIMRQERERRLQVLLSVIGFLDFSSDPQRKQKCVIQDSPFLACLCAHWVWDTMMVSKDGDFPYLMKEVNNQMNES